MRELFLAWVWVQLVKVAKERGWMGMEGVYILFSLKRAVGRRGTRRLWVYARRLRATLGFQTLNRARTLRATGSGVSGPIPGVSGYGRGKTPVFAPLSCFVAHKCLSRFSWALVSNQSPWIKSLLIVRRSYTQNSNIKSNSMSILWTPLFHFLFEGSYIVTWFTYTNSPPAHTLNYTIKCTCVLSLTPKPT